MDTQAIRFILFIVLLYSCSPRSCWLYQEVDSDCPQYNSANLTHPSANTFNGIGLQLLTGPFGTLGYLNVYCGSIPSFDEEGRTAKVLFIIDGTHYQFDGILHEGQQKVLLPDEATQLVIRALLDNQSVCIVMKGYLGEISAVGFCSRYNRSIKYSS